MGNLEAHREQGQFNETEWNICQTYFPQRLREKIKSQPSETFNELGYFHEHNLNITCILILEINRRFLFAPLFHVLLFKCNMTAQKQVPSASSENRYAQVGQRPHF